MKPTKSKAFVWLCCLSIRDGYLWPLAAKGNSRRPRLSQSYFVVINSWYSDAKHLMQNLKKRQHHHLNIHEVGGN
jgi:hypothetical protein